MHRFAIVVFMMVLCCAVASSFSATIHVPSQQPTIQAGINAAVNGDTVLVAPGVYVENIRFNGKRICVIAAAGASTTAITAADTTAAVVSMVDGEPKGTLLQGFTIQGGGRSGVLCIDSSPTIIGNHITGNQSIESNDGGGISLKNTSGSIIRANWIWGNSPGSFGGAIHVGDDDMFSSNDTICYNVMYGNDGSWDIRVLGLVDGLSVFNNTIAVKRRTALLHEGSGLVDFRNNIVINSPYEALFDSPAFAGTVTAQYNCLYGNGSLSFNVIIDLTNLLADPKLTPGLDSTYVLLGDSPCINAGDPNPVFNDPGGTRNDIGALPHSRVPMTLYVPSLFSNIQSAIDSAINGDTITVAPGTYIGLGNYNISTKGKRILLRSTHGADSTILNIHHEDELPDRGFNFTHGEDSTTVIQGFTVTSPISSNNYAREGGALRCTNSSPKIVDCVFSRQRSGSGPGAVLLESSSAIFESCTFQYNLAGNSAFLSKVGSVDPAVGGSGGGVWALASNLVFRNCHFELNATDEGSGGAVSGNNSSLKFTNCSFVHNGANGDDNPGVGGAVHGNGLFVDCLFEGNSARWSGGAVVGDCDFLRCSFRDNFTEEEDVDGGGAFAGTGTFDSCTLVGNRADIGNAIVGTVTIANSIIAFGVDEESQNFPERVDDCVIGQATISCTNIFGNSGGDWVGDIASQFGVNGNISANPLFCDTASGDFRIAAESPCAPANNSCNQQIGAFGVACSVKPGVTAVGMENEALTNVLSPTPKIQWVVSQPVPSAQDSFLIAVGTDNDWQFAEKWNPAPFASSDTFVVYDGSALLDGQTYYLRLRVHNTLAWSDWYQTSFRMNSVPTSPVLRAPTNLAVVGSTPILWVTNGSDAESDPLTYEFAGFHDTDCVAGPEINLTGVASGVDSTGGQIVDPLAENCRYWWMARAYDGYEYSPWTSYAQFLVNGTPEAPAAPTLDYPPLPDNKPIFTLLPILDWQISHDPDPGDTVRYKLELSDRANFSFALVRDSLLSTDLPLTDSLLFGTHYYWRVTAKDKSGLSAMSGVKEFWTWKLGDMNHSHTTDLSDLSLLIAYLTQTPRPDISPKMVADLTADCRIDLSDLSTMVAFMTTTGVVLTVGCE